MGFKSQVGPARPDLKITISLLPALPQTSVARSNDRLRAVSHLQLAEDLGDVIADGLRTQHQPFGDRAVGQPLGNQGQHLTLAFGEVGKDWRFSRRGGISRAVVPKAASTFAALYLRR